MCESAAISFAKAQAVLQMNSWEQVAMSRRRPDVRIAAQPRKKAYETALMVRRVKSYLANLTVIEDESRLDQMSLECEPSIASMSTSSLTAAMAAAKRQPSPSPSSNSSNSAADQHRRFVGPKFGADSPQAVQKLMTLVEATRIRPRHTGGGGGHSPVASPAAPRKQKLRPAITQNGGAGAMAPNVHLRSQSETLGNAPLPVNLTAECSSVTNFLSPNRMHSGGTFIRSANFNPSRTDRRPNCDRRSRIADSYFIR